MNPDAYYLKYGHRVRVEELEELEDDSNMKELQCEDPAAVSNALRRTAR